MCFIISMCPASKLELISVHVLTLYLLAAGAEECSPFWSPTCLLLLMVCCAVLALTPCRAVCSYNLDTVVADSTTASNYINRQWGEKNAHHLCLAVLHAVLCFGE